MQLHRIFISKRCQPCGQEALRTNTLWECRQALPPRRRLNGPSFVQFCFVSSFVHDRIMRTANAGQVTLLVLVPLPEVATHTTLVLLPQYFMLKPLAMWLLAPAVGLYIKNARVHPPVPPILNPLLTKLIHTRTSKAAGPPGTPSRNLPLQTTMTAICVGGMNASGNCTRLMLGRIMIDGGITCENPFSSNCCEDSCFLYCGSILILLQVLFLRALSRQSPALHHHSPCHHHFLVASAL